MSRFTTFAELTEPVIRECIERSRGDLLVASRILSVRLKDLMEACESVPGLKAHLLLVNATREANPDFLRMSDDQFSSSLRRNKKVYAVDALEEMHRLAMMEIDAENAEMNNVKLKACVELAKGTEAGGEGSELAEVLRELNNQYRESAPRIKSLRIELEMQQGLIEVEPETAIPAPSTPPALPLHADAEIEAVPSAVSEPEPQTVPSQSIARGSRRGRARTSPRESIPAGAEPS